MIWKVVYINIFIYTLKFLLVEAPIVSSTYDEPIIRCGRRSLAAGMLTPDSPQVPFWRIFFLSSIGLLGGGKPEAITTIPNSG